MSPGAVRRSHPNHPEFKTVRQKVQEIACPDCLRQRLRVFRVDNSREPGYLIADPLQSVGYELEPWQLYVLEILTECQSFARLSLMVEDRFGQAVTREEVDGLLAMIVDKRLVAVSAHAAPLLADFDRRRPRSPEGPRAPDAAAETGVAPLAPEVRLALGLGDRERTKGSELFDPSGLLRIAHPLLAPLRQSVYLLPLVLLPAFAIAFRYHHEFSDDLLQWFGRLSIAWHALFGLFTVNLLVTFLSALVAYNYGVVVSAFCITFYFVIWPRFTVRVGNVKELPRRERAWYYAAPILLRLAIFSVAMLVWFNTRSTEGVPAKFSLALALITQISTLLAVIPFRESNGYSLLATVLDEPKLREKATNTLVNKLRGRKTARADERALVLYALVTGLFMLAVIAVFFVLLGRFLEAHAGGAAGVLALVIVGVALWIRIAGKLKRIRVTNERADRFTTWRDRGTRRAD